MTLTLQLETNKQTMRVQSRSTRREISADERERAAESVAEIGLEFLNLSPGIVGAYFPVRSEFDCLPLIRRLVNSGWRLALPIVIGSEPLEFREWTFGAAMQTGPFGIPQPAEGETVRPSVMLVPLLAFDQRCYRLGYGGGHYDRTLAALRKQGEIIGIGLAFDNQQVEEVPVCPYDEKLDWILTPSGPISAN